MRNPNIAMETAYEVKAIVDKMMAVAAMLKKDDRGFPFRLAGMLKGLKGNAGVREGDAGERGRGIFATRRLKKGDVATTYPCDMMRMTRPDGSRGIVGDVGDEVEYKRRGLDRYLQLLRRDDDGTMYELCGDPSRPFEAGACGHLVNDPHPDPMKIETPTSVAAYGKGMIEYVLRAQGAANCAQRPYRGVCVLVEATRDIEVGAVRPW